MKFGRVLLTLKLCAALAMLTTMRAQAASRWEQPAVQLAAQVAEILGPGQVQMTLVNRSSVEAQEIPAIRKLLEQDLKAHGIGVSGVESANTIRVTLSENSRERLWVAEVVEGAQTQVTMVHVDRDAQAAPAVETGMVLKKKRLWGTIDTPASGSASGSVDGPVLAAIEIHGALIALEQEQIVLLSGTSTGWREQKRWNLEMGRSLSRDPRGLLTPAADGNEFIANVPGQECDGSYAASADANASGEWSVHCHESDDPWPLITGIADVHAFYNASRDFFTGVINSNQGPNRGIDLMPFYSMAALPRPTEGRPALLMTGTDGKVRLMEGNSLRTVSGARDWGSDLAAIVTSCGAGSQVLASSSGEAESDSLRAYEVKAQEAVSVSAPLDMGGTVLGLSSAPDGAGAWAIVRKGAREYEVDRVTALCP